MATVEKWRRIVPVYYLGGLHRKGQSQITVMVAQHEYHVKAEVGAKIEVEEWVARELMARYKKGGYQTFTTNAAIANKIKMGKPAQTVVQVEMTDEQIEARYLALQAKKAEAKGKKKKDDTPDLNDQLQDLEQDLAKEMA